MTQCKKQKTNPLCRLAAKIGRKDGYQRCDQALAVIKAQQEQQRQMGNERIKLTDGAFGKNEVCTELQRAADTAKSQKNQDI